MKGIKMTETPWMLMAKVNDCEHCDRLLNCTYKDLMLCFMSNVDHVVEMTKEETEDLTKE